MASDELGLIFDAYMNMYVGDSSYLIYEKSITVTLPFIHKTIVCVHQTKPRKNKH